MSIAVKIRNFCKGQVSTTLQALFPLHIHYLSIIHPSHFIISRTNPISARKFIEKANRASSPFSKNYIISHHSHTVRRLLQSNGTHKILRKYKHRKCRKQERHKSMWFTQFGLCSRRNNQSFFYYIIQQTEEI